MISNTKAGDESRAGRLPDFLIIGAQKCGTTTLLELLNRHPDVHCEQEIHFFCEQSSRGLDWYARQLERGRDMRRLGEKCPHYLSHPEAPGRIAEALPGVRLMVILRDPVERTYAHYWHQRRRWQEPLDLPDALAAEEDRKRQGLEHFGYVERSRYLPQLERVCQHHPRERLHVLLLEDLVSSPDPVLAEVCDFLDVAAVDAELELPNANAYRQHRPRWLWDLMARRRLWRMLPGPAARGLAAAMTRERPYPPLERDIERELRSRFEPDNRALAAWLDRDLAAWGVDAT